MVGQDRIGQENSVPLRSRIWQRTRTSTISLFTSCNLSRAAPRTRSRWDSVNPSSKTLRTYRCSVRFEPSMAARSNSGMVSRNDGFFSASSRTSSSRNGCLLQHAGNFGTSGPAQLARWTVNLSTSGSLSGSRYCKSSRLIECPVDLPASTGGPIPRGKPP